MIIRNNPFNLRRTSANRWLGEESPWRGFCTFDTVEHGIRAYLIVIRSYMVKHNLYRICDIINRFAPSSENNTLAYLLYVCGDNYHDDDKIDSLDMLCVIAQRMAHFESNAFISQDSIYRIAVHYHIFDHVLITR